MVSPIDWGFRKKLSGGLTPILMVVSHIALAQVTISVAKADFEISSKPTLRVQSGEAQLRQKRTLPMTAAERSRAAKRTAIWILRSRRLIYGQYCTMSARQRLAEEETMFRTGERFCFAAGIAVMAFSPLSSARADFFDDARQMFQKDIPHFFQAGVPHFFQDARMTSLAHSAGSRPATPERRASRVKIPGGRRLAETNVARRPRATEAGRTKSRWSTIDRREPVAKLLLRRTACCC